MVRLEGLADTSRIDELTSVDVQNPTLPSTCAPFPHPQFAAVQSRGTDDELLPGKTISTPEFRALFEFEDERRSAERQK